jgi:predicted  nucleic acid-binding Zn-ribbon protein
MTKENTNKLEDKSVSVEEKLKALYHLQQIDTQIDKIKIVRGELPLEVEDLEDEIAGLETRVANFEEDKAKFTQFITDKLNAIKDSKALIQRYEEQQKNVRNNREYDSLTKEIEFQNLEIQLAEKKIKEAQFRLESLDTDIQDAKERLEMRQQDLKAKKEELTTIVAETEKDEKELERLSKENESLIEPRLLSAYKRIRKNARNGLAVVQIERDSCGGCFNKIPPQHQLDIKLHKKIIVCEYCGRVLVDQEIADAVNGKTSED